ncbi:MAG: chondroitinase-B domain-containing protein, partial [Pseudomonadota bacterium]|nr:chondroitinase-B domain-containing protein [Pseudomonadota bacterium]
NGTVNAPVNRYGQVVNAQIENNTFIDVDNIQLGAGSDAERNAPPVNSRMYQNLVFNDNTTDVFKIFDDMSGIAFANTVLHKVNSANLKQGFSSKTLTMKRNAAGLLMPQGEAYKNIGASSSLRPINKEDVGPQWYEKKVDQVAFDSGKVIRVDAGIEDSLFNAIAVAKTGDQLVLAPGRYKIAKLLAIDKVLSISAKKSGTVVLLPNRTTMFEIQNGGSLKLSNLRIDGSESPDSAGNILIHTLKSGMYVSYRLFVENTIVENLNVNHSHHFLNAGSRSLAEDIRIQGSTFNKVTGDLLKLDKEIDDLGNYNAETLVMNKNHFTNIEGSLLSMYRGGTDESTFGPHLLFTQNRVEKVGQGSRNKRKASLYLHGVQYTRIHDNHFMDAAGIVIEHTVGDPDTEIRANRFSKMPALKVAELHTKGDSTVKYFDNRDD